MILNFRSRALQRVFVGDVRRVQPAVAQRIRNVLAVLHTAQSLQDVSSLTGFYSLSGNRSGTYAITVTRNWRITFVPAPNSANDRVTQEKREEFHVRDVDYEDYH